MFFMNKCVFCDSGKLLEDILYQEENFFVKVGFGLVSAGHTLLVSKEHYLCFGAIPDELDERYTQMRRLVTEQVTKEFAKPFLIEYGVWGQSVPHAHLHFIPSQTENYEIKSLINEMVAPGKIRFEEVDLRKLKEIYRKEKMYVSIEENGNLFVCYASDVAPYNPDNPNPNLSYRSFFSNRGLFWTKGWKNMTEESKMIDDKNREITKKKLHFD